MAYVRPDYSVARGNAGFNFSVASGQGALRELTGVPIREFNLEPEACIEAYRRGRPMIREMFGEDVRLPGVSTPAISYGHVDGLGSELLFPEGGEVAHTHIYTSLEEGIEALKQPVDFPTAGMAPYFIEFRDKLIEAFPGEGVGLSYGLEGPLTTAYEVRGDGIFIDFMDNPDTFKQFMELLVDSILQFHRFLCGLSGRDPINPSGAGMCDDISSFVPPHLFADLVLPYWDQYFSGMTTGVRSAHVEDLRPDQLHFLEDIGLSSYDPSISPQLHPQIIARRCRVPFAWRLGSYHYREMTCRDVEDFVFQACADGASSVTTHVAEIMCNEETVPKVHAFIRAGKEAKRLVTEGCPRKEIAQKVSAEGQENLWHDWTGYKGA